jgi:SAM-dependent methyltransferase
MSTADRLASEQAFHDRQARERAADLAADADLRFADQEWLGHETWIRPAFAHLGDLTGQPALDFGCGHGMAAVVLARRGASVTAFDLSPGYLAEARRRAIANGVAVECVQADGERLPFPDASFSGIWGNAVLHHLNLRIAAAELWRVLRPGGVAVFCEPWGENPLLRWTRRRLPYPGKERTPDEEPLRQRDLIPLRSTFPTLAVEGHQLLSMARRVLPPGRLVAGLERCDRWLLGAVPGLRRYCRYVVIVMRKEPRPIPTPSAGRQRRVGYSKGGSHPTGTAGFTLVRAVQGGLVGAAITLPVTMVLGGVGGAIFRLAPCYANGDPSPVAGAMFGMFASLVLLAVPLGLIGAIIGSLVAVYNHKRH